nr:uncharacterized protein LOC127299464 [Lolium perenne]
MRISGSSAVLVALLALATVVVGGTAASVCDGVSSCGMGSCNEHLIPILSAYVCDCYPGWHRLLPIPTSAPCYIPFCPTDFTCYIPTPKFPPIGSNVTLNPCLFMDCGPEGTCVEEKDKPLRCQCKQGATNSLNDPSLPCIKGCVIGKDGCPVPTPPPPPPSPPSSSPSMAPPGSVRLGSLLLLALLAALHVV